MSAKKPRLGLDLGGVIIDKYAIDLDTGVRYPRHHQDIPEVDYSIDVVRYLVDMDVDVFVVSSGYREVVVGRRRWLMAHRFFERTLLRPSRLRFCEERGNKAQFCKELGLTHFVDDRLDVLLSISPGDVPYQYLLRVHDDHAAFQALLPNLPPHIRAFRSWMDLFQVLRRDLERAQDAFEVKRAHTE